MEFEGRIQRVLPVRSGTSQRGEWKTLPFVFEYFENAEQRWSDKVLLETFDTNIMAQIGVYLQKGQDGKAVYENGEARLLGEIKCRVGFSHSVRSGNRQDGTSFCVNDVRLYKFEILTGVQQRPAFNNAGTTATPQQAPQYAQQAQGPIQGGGALGLPNSQPANTETDDLPF